MLDDSTGARALARVLLGAAAARAGARGEAAQRHRRLDAAAHSGGAGAL